MTLQQLGAGEAERWVSTCPAYLLGPLHVAAVYGLIQASSQHGGHGAVRRLAVWPEASVGIFLGNCVEIDSTFMTSVQFSSVVQSCPTLCDPMNRSTPGLPVHHQLPDFTQTHAHRVGDAIQPSHPLSSPSPPAPNPSQHQGLFQ